MALSLSNPNLFSPTTLPSSISKPFCLLKLKPDSLHTHHFSRPIIHHHLSNSSSTRSWRFVKASFSFQDPINSTFDDEESSSNAATASQSRPDLKQLPSLQTLMKAYKKAVQIGDMEVVSQIEAMICMIEKEKNELIEKVSALSAEITSGKEKYIRLQADFDNFRKRSDKERRSIRSDAQGEVIESLLPMVDNFERAKQQINPETDMEQKIVTSYQGIYKQFVEIMRSLRVSAVATVGKPFDPSMHEAIAREESQEFKEGIVVQEFRRGFILGDRLLRPAMVKVSSGPGSKKVSAPASEKSTGELTAAARVDE